MFEIKSEAEFVASVKALESPRKEAYEPEFDDLYYLYRFVRENSIVSVLEFGGGWSTYALGLGLIENKALFGMPYEEAVRDPNPFRLLSVDASEEWAHVTASRLPDEVRELTIFHCSKPALAYSSRSGEFVSFYEDLPYFCPGLIYLDGPDPDQVDGALNGFMPIQPHTLPMAADILRFESQLWPGTFIISDGRQGNARMLKRNLTRNWEYLTDMFGDHAIMRLSEESLGSASEDAVRIRLLAARSLRKKELPITMRDSAKKVE